jgi:hypothetical protein
MGTEIGRKSQMKNRQFSKRSFSTVSANSRRSTGKKNPARGRVLPEFLKLNRWAV